MAFSKILVMLFSKNKSGSSNKCYDGIKEKDMQDVTDLVSSTDNKDIGSRSLNMTFKIWNSPPIFMNDIVLIFFGPIYMRNLASALFSVVTHPRALLKVLTILLYHKCQCDVDLLLIFHQRAANSNFLTRLKYSRFWANISITIWRNEICIYMSPPISIHLGKF